MNLRLGLSALAVVGAAVAVYLWTPVESTTQDLPLPPVQQASPDKEPPKLAVDYVAPPVLREPDAAAKSRLVRLPNGDFVPSLNGVVDAPAMRWPDDRPYAQIIGRERDGRGQEWYVHADGSKSTTTSIYRSDLGRYDSTTQVANPTTPLPMEPNELEQAKRAGAGGTGATPPPKSGSGASGASTSAGNTPSKG